MIEDRILPALHARLSTALAPPSVPLVRFEADGVLVGELTEPRARRLAAFTEVFDVDAHRVTFVAGCASIEGRTSAMGRVARTLSAEGALSAWRDERYEVHTHDGAPPAFLLERAAARYFGVRTRAVHVNGLVDTGTGAAMWIARRSPTKAIDPGMLDNLVGGGIAAGATVAQTLAKEAWEEAGIDAATVSSATPAGTIHVRRLQRDGLQHETIHVHDLWLPREFVPANQDGEAVEHRRGALATLPALLVHDDGPEALTADASLVALDALLRLGVIDADDPLHPWLAALCGQGR
jgi:8-oxo-dGTP pyrophosphatase MutT (NUDIX family)